MLTMGAGALRLLLLALLSVGVIGMHTVGHANDHGSWNGAASDADTHATGVAAAALDGGVNVPAWPTEAIDPCDSHCGGVAPVAAVRPGSDSDSVPGGTGLLIVCLAVLGGLGALALLASALGRRYRTPTGAVRATPPNSARTAPTVVDRFSIHLVEVAVLRI